MLTRRHLLLAAAATPFMPRRLWAGTVLEMGGVRIDTLSDGFLALPPEFTLDGMTPDQIADLSARFQLPAGLHTPPCNVTLLRDGTNTVLFDVGSGPDFMPSAGKLPEALAALDLTPDDITHVVFTHGHPDHLWGLLDDFDEPLFAEAQYMIGGAEFDYWMDPATVETIGESRVTFALGAARRLAVIADQVQQLADGDQVLPGVTARLTPGHTPGHMSFAVDAGGAAALIVGDAIANHHVAFDQPDFRSASDQDPELAAVTRGALLAELAASDRRLIGFHLPEGGVGRVVRDGAAYRFSAE